jgi:hypothetical protein
MSPIVTILSRPVYSKHQTISQTPLTYAYSIMSIHILSNCSGYGSSFDLSFIH